MSISSVHVDEAASYAKEALAGGLGPEGKAEVGLILGSGLGSVADSIEDKASIQYGKIPHMAQSTVPGHAGCLVAGRLSGKQVVCMSGRLHAYEGHSPQQIALPVYVMQALGIGTLVITNAVGGINTSYQVGDIVSIKDHINFTGQNPLIGPRDKDLPSPFADMSYAYSPRLRKLVQQTAEDAGIEVPQGVYIGDLGPSFETPAEIRAFRTLGADVVGMSTVFEVIAAAQLGVETAVLSLVTNMAAGVLDEPITAEEVARVGIQRAGVMRGLVTSLVERL